MARLECGSGERGENSLLVDDWFVFLIDVALPAGVMLGWSAYAECRALRRTSSCSAATIPAADTG